MSPKKRLPQNKGLPQRWRHRKNGYYYRVPAGQEHAWEGKTEFHLGKKPSEAYRAYAERIESPENMHYVQDLLNRYSLEVLPDKAPKTQVNELVYIRRLSAVFHNVRIDAVEPVHVYQFMDAAIKKHGGTTANHMVGVLSHAYTKAIEWGQCRDHPIKGKVIKRKVIVKRMVPEMHHIEAAMSILTDKQGMLRHYIELKLMTSLRMTDMLSLRCSDIKQDGLHVTPSKTANSTGKSLIFEYDDNNVLWATLESIRATQSTSSRFTYFQTVKASRILI
ncbi:MAG: hypothetical protein ACI9SP_001615 [Arenicella sp.]|jgi:hypothetical protein